MGKPLATFRKATKGSTGCRIFTLLIFECRMADNAKTSKTYLCISVQVACCLRVDRIASVSVWFIAALGWIREILLLGAFRRMSAVTCASDTKIDFMHNHDLHRLGLLLVASGNQRTTFHLGQNMPVSTQESTRLMHFHTARNHLASLAALLTSNQGLGDVTPSAS